MGNDMTETAPRAEKCAIRDIGKRFVDYSGREITALEKVSFDIVENEICVILGPSGCGKSTLLRLIAGLDTASEGSITIGGGAVAGPGRDRGMVFQAYTSFDWLTVRRNVEYGMRINGVDRATRRERAERFIRLVQLQDFTESYPSNLSGGMRQRVAIARTLANEPEMLLMDEPFGALDAETRWHMQELLIGIVENTRTTVVMVTHDIEEAIFVADRIIFMSARPGRIHQIFVPAFKGKKRVMNKEEVLAMDDYAALEREIMQLMRQLGNK